MKGSHPEKLGMRERTVRIQARQPVGSLPKAMSPESGPIHSSWSRLDHLYRIGRIFAEFENTENPLEATLAVVANTLPIRSAIVIEEVGGNDADIRMWAGGEVNHELGPAKAHAVAMYSYFAQSTSTVDVDSALNLEDSVGIKKSHDDMNF